MHCAGETGTTTPVGVRGKDGPTVFERRRVCVEDLVELRGRDSGGTGVVLGILSGCVVVSVPKPDTDPGQDPDGGF